MEDVWRNQVKCIGSFKHSQWRARSRPEIYSSLYHYLLSGLCIYLLLQPCCFYRCPSLVQSQPSYKWKQVRLPYSPAQNLPGAPNLTQVKKASVLSSTPGLCDLLAPPSCAFISSLDTWLLFFQTVVFLLYFQWAMDSLCRGSFFYLEYYVPWKLHLLLTLFLPSDLCSNADFFFNKF